MRKLLFLLIFSLLSVASTQAQVPDNAYNPLELEHDGITRMAHIYEPEGDINAVMIALHGFTSSGRALEALSGLNAVADERGWVIIYPEAAQLYWDDGRIEAGLPPLNGAVDDVGYLAALADTVRENYAIEDVYLTGHAQGGSMALRAVCQTPEKYTSVAIINALMWSHQLHYCNTTEAPILMDMLFLKGTNDHLYWTNGRQVNDAQWGMLGVVDTIGFWSARHNCEGFVQSDVEGSGLAISQNCNNDTTLAFLPTINGGNNWSRSGDNILNNRGIDTAELIAGFFAKDENWQEASVQSVIPNDDPRSYSLYVPTSYDPTTPTPLVVSLHGRGANNFSQALSSGFNQVAEEHGFIVVYPQAYDPNFFDPSQADAVWNYNLNTSLLVAYEWDDELFLDSMVDDLAQVLNIDMNRLYVNGLSNGGYMTNRLGCTRGNRYAAFAAVAANAPFGLTELCEDGVHAPILYYHGTADTISPWDGLTINSSRTGSEVFVLAPIPNSLAFWVVQNGCGQQYVQHNIASTDPDSSVIHARYTDCPDDAAVEIYAVVGGGHVWHGVQDFEGAALGEVNMDINASEAIWAFYSQYTLEGRNDDNAVELELELESTSEGFGVPVFPLTLEEMQTMANEQ